jgi:hypothetical protein
LVHLPARGAPPSAFPLPGFSFIRPKKYESTKYESTRVYGRGAGKKHSPYAPPI